MNLFQYVYNSPINWVDPYGLGVLSVIKKIFDTSGHGKLSGKIVGGTIGAGIGGKIGFTIGSSIGIGLSALGGPFSAPVAYSAYVLGGSIGSGIGGYIGGKIGSTLGGKIGEQFDDKCAGKLNCNEEIPIDPEKDMCKITDGLVCDGNVAGNECK